VLHQQIHDPQQLLHSQIKGQFALSEIKDNFLSVLALLLAGIITENFTTYPNQKVF
jgi:hypothetical protein